MQNIISRTFKKLANLYTEQERKGIVGFLLDDGFYLNITEHSAKFKRNF